MISKTPISRRAFVGAGSAAVASLAWPARADTSKRKLVLMAGKPSHGPLEHEYNGGVTLLKKWLATVPNLDAVVQHDGWPADPDIFKGTSAILCFADGGNGHPLIQGNHLEIIGGLMKQGVGLMCAHYGVEIPKEKGGKELTDWIGGYYETNWSCNPHWKAEFEELPQHPITRGVKPFAIRDEWYFNMRFRPNLEGITPILVAKPGDAVRKGPYASPRGPYPHIVAASGRPESLMWCVERADGGRGVGFTGGHYHRNWLNDNFRKVFLNALLWISKIDVPADGVASTTTEQELLENVDPKGQRNKKGKV
jgi:Trehalose utilisation